MDNKVRIENIDEMLDTFDKLYLEKCYEVNKLKTRVKKERAGKKQLRKVRNILMVFIAGHMILDAIILLIHKISIAVKSCH